MLVAHVALNALSLRRVLDEEPEPDALHAPSYDEPAPDEHAELYVGWNEAMGATVRQKERALGFERPCEVGQCVGA
jgi:hypothetical protein